MCKKSKAIFVTILFIGFSHIWCTLKVNSCVFYFLTYVSDMKQAMSSDRLLYADMTLLWWCRPTIHIIKILTQLNDHFTNLCKWFLEKKKYSFTTQKTKFSFKNVFGKCDQIRNLCGLVTFTEEILNGKFCAVIFERAKLNLFYLGQNTNKKKQVK